MFEKKELVSGIDGSTYTKYFYTFNEADKIVGILFGHFAPFTGPNGHGRMVTALKNIGAESFLIATPDNNKPFDDEREMFNSHQRAEIIQAYLDSEGLDGEAIAYKMKRGGAKSQMGPLVALAAEKFGLNIRPVFCFGPDREDLAADVCNKFGEITDPTHCEYIVDYERGTSGTKVRQLIKANDVDGIVSETGYKPEVAEKLIKLRMENKGMDEFKEAYEMKEWEDYNWRTVKLKFTEPQDAAEFKDEMKDKFNFPKNVSKYQVVHGTTESGNSVFVESFKKTYNEARTPWSFVGTTKEDRSSITGFLHSKGFNYLKSYENEKKAKEFSHYVHENYDDFYGEFLKSDLEDAWKDFNLNESKLDESKESVIGLALLIAAGVGLMKCANNKHIKKLEDAGAYEDYVKYNGSYDFDNGFNEKKVFAYIAECCNKGMTVEEACAAYNDIPSLKRVAQILNVKDLGDTYRVFYRARSGKYWENADITFPKSLENFESSSEGMEIDDVTFSFEESYKNIYNESSTLLPLYHPTEEIEEIVEAIKDEYEAETNYRYDPALYHFEGGDVYIVFTTLDYRKSQELLAPICDSLTGKFDVELTASTCKYGGCIIVTPKKPDPYEDYFYEIYNGPSEVEE